MLISLADAVLAGSLLGLSEQMREHAEAVEGAIASIRNASADLSTWVERVNQLSESILESCNQVEDKLAQEYRLGRAAT